MIYGKVEKWSFDIDTKNNLVHHGVEALSVVILNTIWFLTMSSASYFINELYPPYKETEALFKTWWMLLSEISLTILIFHHLTRALSTAIEIAFKGSSIKMLPQFHGSIMAVWGLLVFQNNLKLRTSKALFSLFGKPRTS